MEYSIRPIGFVHSERTEALDDNWSSINAFVELDPDYSEETLLGLNGFSHIEIIYYFHRVEESELVLAAERPRENPRWPRVGIFAQRKRSRPNLLGTTICKIKGLEGNRIFVEDLDAIDGTPVIDIKPVFRDYLPRTLLEVREPRWANEMMTNYW